MVELYLDNAATTRVDNEVSKVVEEFFLNNYANASSLHKVGQRVREELEKARKKIADFVGCDVSEIIFTSGGTESNNLAIRGVAKANPEKKHIITSRIEHPSVLETCKDMEKDGYKVDYLSVNSDGIVDINELMNTITDKTLIVSVMHVNNEIGTIQPVEEIGKLCKERGAYFHSDAVQSFKKLKLDVSNIDLMSVSGHKFHAPKGIGFLYVKKGVKILPILSGGGQENGIRSGTENVPGIIGMASALNINLKEKDVLKIRNKLIEGLQKISGVRINGSLEKRIWNNINISFYGIEGESLMLMLSEEGIYVSTGSACASTKLNESHVLKAIGVDEMYIHGSIRISLGDIKDGDVDYVLKKINEKVLKLREMSPFKLNSTEEGNG